MRRVCVYCGSRSGSSTVFVEAARELGREILAREWGLVFGGGGTGLMGVLADTVIAGGGEVQGVIPRELLQRELGHDGCSELHVVDSMHERKALMAELADGFVALPGGMGTLEEIAEALTWTQLGVHAKPCGLLSVAGYWGRLVSLLDHFVEQGFMAAEARALVQVAETPSGLLNALTAWQPVERRSWR